jgi:hypothetical protein
MEMGKELGSMNSVRLTVGGTSEMAATDIQMTPCRKEICQYQNKHD